MKTIADYKKKFDDIRHEESGVEFWYARELMELLDYVQWRNFEKTIVKAKISCENNGITVSDHFADASKMIKIGKGGNREVDDYMLTRYACYLIAENGDPRKEQIAFAQSYFAVQTRKQELIEERIAYIERTEARGKLHETALILRTLKDKDGNYLWNHSNDTILGKEVIISEYMPTEGTPVLFGDFSKYLVIDREHLRLRELKELYAMDDRTGYLGFSFLDGRLTKRDAVKILRIL